MSKKPPYLRVWRFYYHLSVGIKLVIVEEIADLARKLADQGASRIYIFFNNDFGDMPLPML